MEDFGVKEDNIDELDDGFESEHDDSNAFSIRDPLQPPSAKSISTKELHSGLLSFTSERSVPHNSPSSDPSRVH